MLNVRQAAQRLAAAGLLLLCCQALNAQTLQARLQQQAPIAGETLGAMAALQSFYSKRNFVVAWSAPGAAGTLAEQMLAAIDNARSHGLDPDDYHRAAIQSLLAQAARADAAQLADLDLLLSDAFFLLGAHLQAGKVNPQTIDTEWFVDRRANDLPALLELALASGVVAAQLETLAPSQVGYARLRAARKQMEALLAAQWPPIAEQPTLKPGMRDARWPQIRARLVQLGDAAAEPVIDSEPEPLYAGDAAIAAVMRFQGRHNLAVDGVIGRATLAALNVAPAQRLQQIDINLERWRWQPAKLGQKFVLVNIAGFELMVVDNGQLVLRKRVVVGRDYRRTPVFSDRIRTIEFNPTWTVPVKLAVKDKLPEIRRDPTYLARLGFTVYQGRGDERRPVDPQTVDWSTVSEAYFPYELVQAPGPENALGRVKFMFPNRFDVYLHDTPSQELFDKPERTFSSGCVRVEGALDLAELLLQAEPGWTRARIETMVSSGEQQVVRLREPVPIHIQYVTAWVDREGVLHFGSDVYERDPALAAVLSAKPR